MKFILVSLALLSVIYFNSCGGDQDIILPSVTGKAGEVLVVMDKASWNSEKGDYFRKLFLRDYPALPQSEPVFEPINIPSSGFDNIFKTHRNVIIVQIGSHIPESKVVAQHDVWAETQLLVTIAATTEEEYDKLLEERGESIVAFIEDAERDRLIDNYKKFTEQNIFKKINDKYHIALNIPKGYTLDTDSADFAWVAHETPMISQGIFIYSYPYRDTSTFTIDYLIRKRDKFLKKYVPGAIDGSYMITAREFPPEFREFTLNGKYVAEVRGLWEVENDYMGGPFISLSTVDEKRGRVVTVEGFVYAPKYDKRNYLRQVEAILYTLKILE
ncbi:MAG: DUF4837 family protein [Bacteroidota bacterium]